ncbi:DNA polymerase beta superfamily protein [Comamonas sp. JC664]|uniref:nucleotidyltransferase domain-containing protein n=1 Tax=Comamonas sp. JC664 TaxID=2801917 RepID=UPI0036154A4C
MIEWFDSPVVYQADPLFVADMRAAIERVHYPSARTTTTCTWRAKNYREYLQGETVRLKKYLYVLRPLLACLWLAEGRGVAPMRFQDLVDGTVADPAVLDAIAALLVVKRAAKESEHGAAMPVLNAFIETTLAQLEAAPAPQTPSVDFAPLDDLLLRTVLSGHTG